MNATRRVLKSVVGPALGATLAALVAGGCKKDDKADKAPEPAKTEPAKAEPVKQEPAAARPPDPPKTAAAADAGVDAAAAEPVKAEQEAPKPEPKKEPPPRHKEKPAPAPKQDKGSPSTEWYASGMLEEGRAPQRRGTDVELPTTTRPLG